MSPMTVSRSRSRGFSLLEVLVAFVILATVVTVLMQVFGGDKLFRAGSVTGTWTEVSGAASPFTPAAGALQFFRTTR